MSLTNKLYNSC